MLRVQKHKDENARENTGRELENLGRSRDENKMTDGRDFVVITRKPVEWNTINDQDPCKKGNFSR